MTRHLRSLLAERFARVLVLSFVVLQWHDMTNAERLQLSDTVKELLQKRLVVAKELLDATMQGFQQGEMSVDQVHDAKRAYLNAQLDLAEQPNDRIRVLTELVKEAGEWEKTVLQRVQTGDLGRVDGLKARLYVLETRIALAREEKKEQS